MILTDDNRKLFSRADLEEWQLAIETFTSGSVDFDAEVADARSPAAEPL
jgi:hypothetical protein